MRLVINGKAEDVGETSTVDGLLKHMGLKDRACAVEVNRMLVPRKRHEEHVLSEGDTVEVVTLVGGG